MHCSVNLVSFANRDVFEMFPGLKYIQRIITVATVARVAISRVNAKYKPERKTSYSGPILQTGFYSGPISKKWTN